MSTFKLYVVSSILLSAGAIYNAYTTSKQFYLTIEYLTTSKPHKSVLLNAGFAIFACIVAKFIKIFFGEIKEIERIVTDSFFIIYPSIP